MSCSICGKGSCSFMFHSLDEQERHERAAAYENDRGAIAELLLDVEMLKQQVAALPDLIAALQGLLAVGSFAKHEGGEEAAQAALSALKKAGIQ